MVYDKLESAENYFAINSGLEAAFNFIKQEGIEKLESAQYEIKGDKVFAIITDNAGKTKNEAKLEAHRKYIDIQFLISGDENIGWRSYKDCRVVQSVFDEAKDAELFFDEPQMYFKLLPGAFVIFFPEDAHAPMISDNKVHKIVVKVAIEQ